MKRIESWEAAEKLLARDRYSSIKHKSFLFDFMEYMSEDGLNLDTKEAQKIYEYFDGAIRRTLENGELELFERDEQDDGTDDKPQEDLALYTPGAGQPPIESGIANCSGSGSKVMQGYVSGSNMGSVPAPEPYELNVKLLENIKDKQNIKIIMDWYNLSRIDAEAVYSRLRDREDDVGKRQGLSLKARETLYRIKVIADMVINL